MTDTKDIWMKEGYDLAKKEILEKVNNFIQERTVEKFKGNKMVLFMPFEWEDFKKQLEKVK